jgi:hypothetical protein
MEDKNCTEMHMASYLTIKINLKLINTIVNVYRSTVSENPFMQLFFGKHLRQF